MCGGYHRQITQADWERMMSPLLVDQQEEAESLLADIAETREKLGSIRTQRFTELDDSDDQPTQRELLRQ